MPSLKINVPLALTSSDIFEGFSHVCRSQKFQIIEMDAQLATAVNKEPFSIKKMFLRCIPFSGLSGDQREAQADQTISAIRLQITINDVKCCRKLTVKGLYGDTGRMQEFIRVFRSIITEKVADIPEHDRLKSR